MTATGGHAAGLLSTEIGVAQTCSTPVGQTLQLIGNFWQLRTRSLGVLNDDFTGL